MATSSNSRRSGRNVESTFDLNLLTVAVALYDCESVTEAAKSLGSSQSAVSMALGRLRAVLGDPLYVRSPTGVTPTPRATRLVASVRPLLAQVRSGLLHDEEFDAASTRNLEEILAERFRALGIPTVSGVMIGHIDDQATLPVGCLAELDADAGTLTLLEPGVS